MKKLLLLLLMILHLIIATSAEVLLPLNASSAGVGEFKPVQPVEYRLIEASMMIGNDTITGQPRRRRLEPYQVCLVCKCCAEASATTCSSMPCCFGIDCQLPNKPFGVCAFVPKTCNCTSCPA
ncbi:uncharacterized protein LOC126655400 [Mercurialis annua]|uniref:uncharacterized protein LOC126655400 n=1 Tax=Mercurialis annua TaxID=3986 RepID=UPI002160DB71|nr:uncharacterized protein LOC126655400 [Mercurialis annua]